MLTDIVHSDNYWIVEKASNYTDQEPSYVIYPTNNQVDFNSTPPRASRTLTKIFDMYHGYNFTFTNNQERICIHVRKVINAV